MGPRAEELASQAHPCRVGRVEGDEVGKRRGLEACGCEGGTFMKVTRAGMGFRESVDGKRHCWGDRGKSGCLSVGKEVSLEDGDDVPIVRWKVDLKGWSF